MEENIKVRWLTDHEQTKIAPKTLVTQVYNEDGTRLNDTLEAERQKLQGHMDNGDVHVTAEEKAAWNSIEVPSLEGYATETYVDNLFEQLNASTGLGFYCIEDVTVVVNGVSTIYPANSTVDISLRADDTFEIIPTSDQSILSLTAYPGALGTFHSWLEGVAQFSNILFDMNAEDMYTKWSQGNQGSYHVQTAQYVNCIFWSDNPYISEVARRTNYTLTHTAQLPLCYSTIPDNTFKSFYLAFGVNSDPNWANKAYRDSFAKATWATQAFSYYGARVVGFPGHDSPTLTIVLPKDCRGLMFDARNIECAGTFDAANCTNFGAKSGSWREAFGDCPSLRRLYIKNLNVNLNISWSPVDYASISYIINSATNTNKITISVSPYTYNLLSQVDFDLAASKNITIALISTNYVEDKRLSAIADKADKSYVDTKIADLVNSAPETLDTLGELATALQDNDEVLETLNEAITNKVNKTEFDELVNSLPSEPDVVIVDCPNGTTISHTFEQVMAAVNADKAVYLSLYGTVIAPLTHVAEDDSYVEFYAINNTGVDVFKLNSDDTFAMQSFDLTSNVLLKTEQTLSDEELNQVRNNIKFIGHAVGGTEVTPYTIEEVGLGTADHRIEETPGEPVVAGEGAEVFNLYDGMNVASGLYSVSQGSHTVATGDYSVAQGHWTMATGMASKASGLLTRATGHYSTADGTRTVALKNNCHAEGDVTQATGTTAHSEGNETVASGNVSHAEGWKTTASGIASHAEGEGTIAAGRGQTAMGRWNVSDTSSKLIVGIGTKDSDRKNGFRVSSTGQGYFASDVYANDSKKLATEEFVTQKVAEIEAPTEYDAIILKSSTPGSTKKFRLTIGDDGVLTTEEIV